MHSKGAATNYLIIHKMVLTERKILSGICLTCSNQDVQHMNLSVYVAERLQFLRDRTFMTLGLAN